MSGSEPVSIFKISGDKMKRLTTVMLIVLFSMTFSSARYNPKYGREVTREELVGFIKEALAFIKIYGKKKAIKEFNDKKGLFNRGELYIFAYDYSCRVLAHGANPKWVGNNFIELKDPTGKLIIKDMANIVKRKGSGWIKYRWFHPKTRRIEPKRGYVHRVDNSWWIGSGMYVSN